MIKSIIIGVLAFVISFFVAQNVANGQTVSPTATTTPSPTGVSPSPTVTTTPTTTVTPTPTGTRQIPGGAPATGFGGGY